jgi:hypothetical protein
VIDRRQSSVWKFVLFAHFVSKAFALSLILCGIILRLFGFKFVFDYQANAIGSLFFEWFVNIAFVAFFSSALTKLYATEARDAMQDRELWYWIWLYIALDWSTFGLCNLVETLGVVLILLYILVLYSNGWYLSLTAHHKWEDLKKILITLIPFYVLATVLPAFPKHAESVSNVVGTVMSFVTIWLLFPNTKQAICESNFFYEEFEVNRNTRAAKIVGGLEKYAETYIEGIAEIQDERVFHSLPLFFQWFLPLCLNLRSILLVIDIISRIPTKLMFLHGYVVVVLLFLALAYCIGAFFHIVSFGYWMIPVLICGGGYYWIYGKVPQA